VNYFSPKSAAERYAKGRPAFHHLIVDRIKEILSLTEPLARALDVGCGTGLSTVALTDIAREIVGADISPEMLSFARKEEGISYVVCAGERLALASGAFDLITVSQALHWFERDAFLREARRVLRAGGWLVAYDNYFEGESKETNYFQRWHREVYHAKYPIPPRGAVSLTDEDAARGGFHLFHQELQQHAVRFSLEALIDYLVSQSNVIAAVEGGGEEIEEVRRWMRATLASYFGKASEADFLFNAPIWFLQRADTSEN
jgi:SAM-dependent methyltransferase